jgi:hypothetical protein
MFRPVMAPCPEIVEMVLLDTEVPPNPLMVIPIMQMFHQSNWQGIPCNGLSSVTGTSNTPTC